MFDLITLIPGILPMEGVPITDVIGDAINDASKVIKAAISVAVIAFVGVNILKSGFSLARILVLVATSALVIWALMYDGIGTIATTVDAYFASRTEG